MSASKVEWLIPQNQQKPPGLLFGIFHPGFQFTFGFLAKIIKLQHILTKKINILNFRHFLQPPPSGPQFWPI